MKKILTLIIGLLMYSNSVLADSQKAITFVETLANDMIVDVLATQKPMTEKLDLFREKFHQALDLKSIGQFVLGVYWRKATPIERDEFIKAFMDFSTKSWADKFNMYNGQKIVFKGSRPAQKNQLYIDSVIQNNPPVEVIWRVREKNNEYKIVDIVVEGVSMAMSYRNEYTSFLQQNKGDVAKLTQELNQKSQAFKFADEK
ncbi:MAG: ABC transporter substrate-binding protein [Alphaproteobacteria bacterium]|nr:ABC transporter substrate-binding protein [Alphaproteobacteria bacterium]